MDSDYIQTVRFIYMNIFYSEMTIITALFVSVVLVSCSNDEGDEKIGASSSKHIVREIYDDGRNIVMTEYFYDSRGRVIKTNETEADSRGTKSATSTYTYGEGTIISQTKGDWNNGEVHTYTLSDGIVSKEIIRVGQEHNNNDYYYDSDGHIKTKKFYGGANNGELQFSWSDGVIKQYTKHWNNDSDTYTYTISYSNIPWPKNFIFYWKGTDMDAVLEPLGAWGKMPKYLPVKFERSDGSVFSVDYVIENGMVTKVIFDSETHVLERE